MKVKALADGFHAGHRRRLGKVFEVAEGTKARWFVPTAEVKAPAEEQKAGKAEKAGKAAKGAKAPETLSELSQTTVTDGPAALA
jgi:hypothetical protein